MDGLTSSKSLGEILNRITQMFYAGVLNEQKMKDLKKILSNVQNTYANLVTTWCDADGLDLLHHSIIINSPELVELLLTDNSFFPSTHIPNSNPYAHLAAILGHAQCLRIILQARPGFFFVTWLSKHAINLPLKIKKFLKFVEPSTSKKMDKLLEQVKSSTAAAENRITKTNTLNNEDVTSRLEADLGSLNNNDGASGRRKNYKLTSASFARYMLAKQQQERKQDKTSNGKNLKEVKRQEGRHCPDKHRIDTDWDFWSVSKPGILKGAGEKIIVKLKKRLPLGKLSLTTPYMLYHENAMKDVITPSGKMSISNRIKESQLSTTGTRFDIFSTENRSVLTNPSESHTFPTATTSSSRAQSIPLSGMLSFAKMKASKVSSTSKIYENVHNAGSTSSQPNVNMKKPESVEIGIRGNKKYKHFELKTETRISNDEWKKYMGKSPLILAAERGFTDCVQAMLEILVLKNNPMMSVTGPLTLATKARSPEAILLLIKEKFSAEDYQSAVLLAIREMYPDCLLTLLKSATKERQMLFDGTNLFHVLFSQNLMDNYRYEMLPAMTSVLITSKEDVNAYKVPRTFPLYTLINCAFNISIGRKIFFYIDCLQLLLEAKANPHFNEEVKEKDTPKDDRAFSRQPFSSAINCIFESAKNSVKFFESTYWSKLFMKKFVSTVEAYDQTSRRILNEVLFDYMDSACELGVDRTIIRALMRYGGNPNFRKDGKFAINMYFDRLLPYLTKFEIINSYTYYKNELTDLMIMCRGMTYTCLKEATVIFLDEHYLTTPIQGLPLCRYFAYLIDNIMKSPRPLSQLAANVIWLSVERNVKRAKLLPLPNEFLSQVIP